MKKAKPNNWSPVSPNFVTESTPMSDVLDLIAPEVGESMSTVNSDETMDGVVVMLGKFPSRNQARKNGWLGPIPEGFNVWQVGKSQFCTLNTTE